MSPSGDREKKNNIKKSLNADHRKSKRLGRDVVQEGAKTVWREGGSGFV